VRSGLSVIAGFTLLSITGMSYAIVFYVGPLRSIGLTAIFLISIPYNLLCAVGVGYLVALIAGRRIMFHAYVVASLLVAISIVSMVLDIALEPLSYKIVYMILMAAGTILGGYLRQRQFRHLTT